MSDRDRLAAGYVPGFDVLHAVGTQGELLWLDGVVRSLVDGSAEVKHDTVATETGNFYIEYRCLRADGWQPSGIAATTAEWWVVAANGVVIAAPPERVRNLARTYYTAGRTAEVRVSDHPTRGVIIPVGEYARRLVTGT